MTALAEPVAALQVRPSFAYAPADPGAAPCVTVYTRLGASDPEAVLDAVAARLHGQSLQQWEWLVAGPGVRGKIAIGDPRMRLIEDEAATAGGVATVARAACVLPLEPSHPLGPTFLETWCWQRLSERDGTSDGPDAAGHLTVVDELPFHNRLAKTHPRVLLLLPWLALGGADKFNLDLLQQLGARGWEVTIATTLRAEQSWRADFVSKTADIFDLPRFLRLGDYRRFVRYLVASRNVDAVVISHSEFGYFMLPYLRAHFPGLAIVDFCHIEEEHWKGGGFPRQSLTYRHLLDRTIVSSAHLRDWMVARGADPADVAVCYTGVDSDAWHSDSARRTAARAELGFDGNTPVILCAARLCPQKRPDVLADTLIRLDAQGVSFTALVAGDGPDRRALRRAVNRHGLGQRVRMLGAVSNERMRDLLSVPDVFFLPSRNEGISLAIYEAMAVGVCIVGADVGARGNWSRPSVACSCTRRIRSPTPNASQECWATFYAALRAARPWGRPRARVAGSFRVEHMGEQMESYLTDTIQTAARRPPAAAASIAPALAEQAVASLWTAEMAHSLDPYRADWRTLAYHALRGVLGSRYERALARDWSWPATLKDALKRWLVR